MGSAMSALDWEFAISMAAFAGIYVLVTLWSARRVAPDQRRRLWLTQTAVFVLVVAALASWQIWL